MRLVPLYGTPDRPPPPSPTINLKKQNKKYETCQRKSSTSKLHFYYCLLCFSEWSNFSVFGKLTVCKEGHAVAQLVEPLRYTPAGRGFDFRWCHWNFSLTKSFRSHYGPGSDSPSNRNEYQEYFLEGKGGRCVGLKNLPPSCADCLEI